MNFDDLRPPVCPSVRTGRLTSGVAAVAIFVMAAGCSREGPPVVPAGGVVLLDGGPLAGALVEFQPRDALGSPSYAATDDRGEFDLAFSQSLRGAWIGQHDVRISTRNENERIPERLPPQYNAETTLTCEVVGGGDNRFQFDLRSDGELREIEARAAIDRGPIPGRIPTR